MREKRASVRLAGSSGASRARPLTATAGSPRAKHERVPRGRHRRVEPEERDARPSGATTAVAAEATRPADSTAATVMTLAVRVGLAETSTPAGAGETAIATKSAGAAIRGHDGRVRHNHAGRVD